jgi:hypothetical protein
MFGSVIEMVRVEMPEMREVDGMLEVVGRARPFGKVFRVPIKIGELWVNVRGSIGAINRKLKDVEIGMMVKARCIVTRRGDFESLWLVSVEKVEEPKD